LQHHRKVTTDKTYSGIAATSHASAWQTEAPRTKHEQEKATCSRNNCNKTNTSNMKMISTITTTNNNYYYY
jgi:hypothetical protein